MTWTGKECVILLRGLLLLLLIAWNLAAGTNASKVTIT